MFLTGVTKLDWHWYNHGQHTKVENNLLMVLLNKKKKKDFVIFLQSWLKWYRLTCFPRWWSLIRNLFFVFTWFKQATSTIHFLFKWKLYFRVFTTYLKFIIIRMSCLTRLWGILFWFGTTISIARNYYNK